MGTPQEMLEILGGLEYEGVSGDADEPYVEILGEDECIAECMGFSFGDIAKAVAGPVVSAHVAVGKAVVKAVKKDGVKGVPAGLFKGAKDFAREPLTQAMLQQSGGAVFAPTKPGTNLSMGTATQIVAKKALAASAKSKQAATLVINATRQAAKTDPEANVGVAVLAKAAQNLAKAARTGAKIGPFYVTPQGRIMFTPKGTRLPPKKPPTRRR